MGPRVVAAIWMACVLAGPSGIARAQSGAAGSARRSAVVTPVTSPISIDGALDEPDWRSAQPIGDLIQRQPDTGQPPTQRTEVRLLRDDDNLYIGVMCYDSEPDRVIGSQMARDATITSDDRLEVLLDTFRDQRNAFYFATNPEGALVDGLAYANGQLNNEWDAIWNVRTRRTSAGWVAEFAIPFKSLSFPAARSVWGFNIARTLQRRLEDDRWSGARLDLQFLQVSEAGEITGLQGLTQGIGLDVRPFLGGRWFRTGATDRDSFSGKPGLDMFYNFTPSLKLTATVNTDFGETEVDARQINLSRFSLLFPEKRSFFLEDAGVFTFASTGPQPPGGIPLTGADVYPFFSRQIGLVAGEEVPIDLGVKLTGRAGRTDIGLLDVRTRQSGTVPEQNFMVGRVRRNILQQSYVGALFTEGDPVLPRSSRTFGADVRLGTSRFLGARRNFVVTGYAARSVTEGKPGKDWSYGMTAHYPNDRFVAQVVLREIQANFTPAVGFVQRRNVRLLRVAGSYDPRPKKFLNIQQMFHDFFFTQFTRLDNAQVESRDFYATWLDWHFKSGDSLHSVLDFNPIYERLFVPFRISPGVVLPPGEYRFTRWRQTFISASKRSWIVSGNWSFGNYWSGTANTLGVTLTYKIPPQFQVSVTSNQTFAQLPQGDFTATILSTSLNFSPSPRVAYSNLVQFDNLSKNLGLQSRLRWTLQPGNDLFFVFSQGWIQDVTRDNRFVAQDSKASAKAQYTVRF